MTLQPAGFLLLNCRLFLNIREFPSLLDAALSLCLKSVAATVMSFSKQNSREVVCKVF